MLKNRASLDSIHYLKNIETFS